MHEPTDPQESDPQESTPPKLESPRPDSVASGSNSMQSGLGNVDSGHIDSDNLAYELDPTFVHARREAWIILAIFTLFAIYGLTVCYWLGYQNPPLESVGLPSQSPPQSPESLPAMMLGMPRWVVIGVLLPWLVANVVTGWFCFFVMRNDSLEDSPVAELDSRASATPAAGDGRSEHA